MAKRETIGSIDDIDMIYVSKITKKADIPDRLFFMVMSPADDDMLETNGEIVQYMTLAAARQRLREKGELT